MAHVTMDDVARDVGVNKGTVSRALRGDSRISPQTREKVWEAAKRLGYQVDAVARGLSSKRSGMAGIAVERMDVPWMGEFLSAATSVLSRARIETMIMEAGAASASFLGIAHRVGRRKLDGLIWLGDQDLSQAQMDVPVVRVGNRTSGGAYCVSLENEECTGRVKALAGDRPVVYRKGPDASMRFLEPLASQPSGSGRPFIIWDGVRAFPEGERPDLVCGNRLVARCMDCARVRLPMRELGVLSARLLLNVVRERGSRPSLTLVKAPLFSASGEPLP